jgi:hypothetical protein
MRGGRTSSRSRETAVQSSKKEENGLVSMTWASIPLDRDAARELATDDEEGFFTRQDD